jgi:alpha-tubulin suppressor-like RCC1 family protein
VRAIRIATLIAAFALIPAASAQATSGGLISGWGYNAYGEIGNGTEASSGCACVTSPQGVPFPEVTEVSAGKYSSLALRADGSVAAWGMNEAGQAGNGEDQRSILMPTPVPGLTGVAAVSSGDDHSLALMGNGTVMAWGANQKGQLGIGSSTGPESCAFPSICSRHPMPVPGIAGAVAVAAGRDFSLALLGDGTVMAWGADIVGQLGDGTGVSSGCECVDHPVAVPGLSGVRAIAAGAYDGMALLDDGTVRSWGNDSFAELGNGTNTPGSGCGCLGPTAPQGLPPARSIAAAEYTEAAVLSDGTARGWGINIGAEAGLGSKGPDECAIGNACSKIPRQVVEVSGGVEIGADDNGFMVRRADGSTVGWGDNADGQIGNGNSKSAKQEPTPGASVVLLSQLDMGGYGGLALSSPTQTVDVSLAGAGTGVVGGKFLSCPSTCAETRPQGETAYLIPTPSAPGQFAGFTGACAGTAACRVRLDADQAVTATFGVPTGTKIRAVVKRRKRKARFSFATPGAVSGYRCLLVKPKRGKRKKPKYRACRSGMKLKRLRPGRYSLKVEALDIVGHEAKPAVRKFKVG